MNDSIWANEDLWDAQGQSQEQQSFLISPWKCHEDIYRHSKFSSIQTPIISGEPDNTRSLRVWDQLKLLVKKDRKFIAPDGVWKKTYCDLHHTTEVRYYCDFKQKFYCMLCIGDHLGHWDEEVNNLAHTIEERINSLNERFEDWRAAIGERLLKHKTNIDKLFEVYYKALDDMKASLLTEEN